MMPAESIRVRGCRVHNLRDIDLDVPRGRLVVVCGKSGSGKTSFALDTLYAEGQRRYIESFSAYTRQFLQRLDKPDCDSIEGLPPAIAVTRAGGSRTSRSTVATATEVSDHLRLLFAKVATLHCHLCGREVHSHDPASAAEAIRQSERPVRLVIGFELVLSGREQAAEVLLGLQQDGFQRLIVAGHPFHLAESPRSELAKAIPRAGTTVTVVVDRLSSDTEISRITESLETAMAEGDGRCVILAEPSSDQRSEPDVELSLPLRVAERGPLANPSLGQFSDWTRTAIGGGRRCHHCEIDFPEPTQRLFNFNQPLGACPRCEGFGDIVEVDMDLVVPDPQRSIREGAIAPWNTPAYRHELEELLALANDYDLPVDVPFKNLKRKHLKIIHQGVAARSFGGLDGFFAWLERKKYKMHIRVLLSRYRSYRRCPECEGRRLRPEVLAYRVGGRDVSEVLGMRGDQLAEFLASIDLPPREGQIAQEPLRQIAQRLGYLDQVGLAYLQLDRTLRTLSGGETQRVALTAALGSSLVNMLYVLDEPTAGLHPHDVGRLRESIERLRNRGNTVVVVEHEETLIRVADELIEFGPGAGEAGGQVVYQGDLAGMLASEASLTGDFLAGRRGGSLIDRQPREPNGFLRVRGASGHNLRRIDVDFPLGVLCLVTGVSGSGKSSLVQDTLYPAVRRLLGLSGPTPLPHESVIGSGGLKHCESVDQAPISRSPRSNPVTYVKAMDAIRTVFSATVEARTRNFGPGHFSFNNELGRCPTCQGDGQLTIDMQFLADVSMRCPACRGSRYRDEILQVHYRDRSIADVLSMSVRAAHAFFRGHDKVRQKLQPLIDVGLDYLPLGQSATTLSSGEAQRLKLAAFLATSARRPTLFVLDEPTTGLHFADIVKLYDCFDALIADGHSLVVVEHNLQLIAAADYLIDLGPGAADEGGRVVVAGTPRSVSREPASRTGEALRRSFANTDEMVKSDG